MIFSSSSLTHIRVRSDATDAVPHVLVLSMSSFNKRHSCIGEHSISIEEQFLFKLVARHNSGTGTGSIVSVSGIEIDN